MGRAVFLSDRRTACRQIGADVGDADRFRRRRADGRKCAPETGRAACGFGWYFSGAYHKKGRESIGKAREKARAATDKATGANMPRILGFSNKSPCFSGVNWKRLPFARELWYNLRHEKI